jgi:hypothetical protein
MSYYGVSTDTATNGVVLHEYDQRRGNHHGYDSSDWTRCGIISKMCKSVMFTKPSDLYCEECFTPQNGTVTTEVTS